MDRLSRSKLITQPPVEFTSPSVNDMHVRAYCWVPIEVPVCFFTSSLDDMSMMCIIQDFMDLYLFVESCFARREIHRECKNTVVLLTLVNTVYHCSIWLLVTSPKVHWSEGSLVRKVTGPNSNPNPYPNPNHYPIPNPKVVFDLRNKETLNSFSYAHAIRPLRNSD